jgi:hypothetical protein
MLQRFARACGRPHETYTNEDVRHLKLVCRKFVDALAELRTHWASAENPPIIMAAAVFAMGQGLLVS